MSDDQFAPERGQALLVQAFKHCEIPERADNQSPPPSNIYWESVNSDIRVVFSYYRAGSVYCSISLNHLATRAAEGFADDQEAIDALIDALKYLESTVSVLLPTTHHKLLRRVFNLKVRRRTSKEQQKGWIALLEQLTPAFSDSRGEMEKQLAAERDWRGGSEARLKKEERQSLHIQYDEIYETSKVIKRDHDTAFLRFDEAHRRSGYTREQWGEFWVKYASELYGYDPAFLSLFANQDNPSASEVAYRHLSVSTGHTRSYVERLVLESRKEAGKPKRRRKPTIKH